MSTVTSTRTEEKAAQKDTLRSWKTAWVYGIFTLVLVALYTIFPPRGSTTFRFFTDRDLIVIPDWTVETNITGFIVNALLIACVIWSFFLIRNDKKVPMWLSMIFAFLVMFGFLTWAGAGELPVPVTSLFVGTISLSVPLVFGALGGVISERAGVVNIAIEGQLLAGAFMAAVTASITGSLFLGLVTAVFAGVLVSFILATFAIRYLVDQVIVGIVLNVLVLGLTGFLYSTVLSQDLAHFNSPGRLGPLPIPLLKNIPIIGPVLFNQTIIEYIMYLAVIGVWFALFKTRWGLRVRAVGENPKAADTVGIKVNVTRFWTVALAGAIVGFGGAYFTLGSVGSFSKEMTAGQGFIALAAVIFGRWDPIRATLAALLFGFATNLQNTLSIIGSPVPSEFMLMLPYLVTVFAVAGFVGHSRAPASTGKPYIKG